MDFGWSYTHVQFVNDALMVFEWKAASSVVSSYYVCSAKSCRFPANFNFIAEPDEWNRIVKKVIGIDNSWNRTAGNYIEVYDSIRVRS